MLIVLIFSSILTLSALEWELFETNIYHLVIRNNTMWKIREDVVNNPAGGRLPYIWDESIQQWKVNPDAYGVYLAVGQTSVYIFNYNKLLFVKPKDYLPTTFVYCSQNGNDIKIGFNDHIWFVSTTAIIGGFTVNKFNPTTNSLTPVPGVGAVKVAPTPDDKAWVVNDSGQILRYDGTNWNLMPGNAKDIYVGANDIPFIVSTTIVDGGYEIMKWNDTAYQWEVLEGIGGISLALDDRDNPHIITSNYSVYRPKKGVILNFCSSIKIFKIVNFD